MGTAKRAIAGLLRQGGYEVRRISSRPDANFVERARQLIERRESQTLEDFVALSDKYSAPVLGYVRVWNLLTRLAECIDPFDWSLGCTSQLTHALQVIEGMQRDGVSDPDLLLSALVHDIGKLLLLTGEDPVNLGGGNAPIGVFEPGSGFDNCTFQWSHGEFGYMRLRDYVPDHVAWLVRYHSMSIARCEHLMDERDERYFRQYYSVFSQYDRRTKSRFEPPRTLIGDYRDLVEEAFPKPIPF